jgi:hypothetical protein
LSQADSLNAYKEQLTELKEEIDRYNPASYGKAVFAKTVASLIEKFLTQIDDIAIDLDKAGGPRQAIEMTRRQLDLFSYEIGKILESSKIPLDMEYFVDQVLEDFGQDLPVVLMPAPALESDDLVTKLRAIMSMFEFPRELKGSCIYVISTPDALVRDPLYWPLIVHEIAHAIEDTSLKTIQRLYPLTGFETPEDVLFVKHEYSMEHEADTIATRYMGPVYVRKLFESYFYEEVTISASHPFWPERFKVMLSEVYKGIDDLEDVRVGLEDIDRGLIPSSSIEHLTEILTEARELLDRRKINFRADRQLLDRVREKLIDFRPYTEDMRILLNAAYFARPAAVKQFVKERAEGRSLDPAEELEFQTRAEKEYKVFIRDCVRLTRLRKLFTKVPPREPTHD